MTTQDKCGSCNITAGDSRAAGVSPELGAWREADAKQAQPMFCFQCQQTRGCVACTGAAGVCGKSAEVSNLEDELTGALVGLAVTAQACQARPTAAVAQLVENALFATLTNVCFDGQRVRSLIEDAHVAADEMARSAGKSRQADYDMARLWGAQQDVRSLKSLILFGMRGVAAYAYHARALGRTDESIDAYLLRGLATLADERAGVDELLPVVLECGAVNFTCMKLLDEGNVSSFGVPTPATVELGVEPGPFIVVTGHDLHDLEQLLEQTDGRGVNVYTHGEMLPAHAYPQLARHPQLKGNFGTAWQNQRIEFDGIPAPVLFTTNCLMPPKASYADRVYVTGPVAYPDAIRVPRGPDGRKDFSGLIDRAIELGGYDEFRPQSGVNGGTRVTTGFGHDAILGVADKVIEAVKAGAVKHIFLVGGCDGAQPGRSYFTDFVKAAPADSLILTLACGKYRFNDLGLGTIGGLPRLLDMGQCNDAYGALVVAMALADAFGCGVNDLPLTLVLSWYEQKAVSILLTLLNLGIKGIYLGPTLPAFVSPAVLDVLVGAYDIHPTTTPEADLKAILG